MGMKNDFNVDVYQHVTYHNRPPHSLSTKICQNISLMCCLSECFQAYFVIDKFNIDSHHIQIEHPLPSD